MTENDRVPIWTKASIPSFITLIRDKVQRCAKLDQQLNAMKNDGIKLATSFLGKSSSFSTNVASSIDVNLEKQLQTWKENPIWTDPSPDIQVTVPKGSLCNLSVKVNIGLPPDAVYNIVTDPDNKRVFKNIKEVVSRQVLFDDGNRQVVELEQSALWRFLWWSGIISVHVLVDQNRQDYTMKFKQVKTGFMKRFEGCWKLEPLFIDENDCHPFVPKNMEDYISCTGGKGRIGSKVWLEQLIQPTMVPPPPISWYLRGITAKTTEMLITDLMEEAGRIRSDYGSVNEGIAPVDDDCSLICGKHDIKERWALQRRNGERFLRRRRRRINVAD